MAAVWTRLRFVGHMCLLGGDLLAQAARDASTGFMRALLDRGEVKLGRGAVIPEHLSCENGEKPLDIGILKETGR